MLLGAAVAALAVNVAAALASSVEPASYENTLEPGGSVTISKTVHTPAIPANPDIVFLSDTTGSMGAAIKNVEENAAGIMTAVSAAQPPGATAQFAVTDYKDGRPGSFPEGCEADPYPFNVGQGLTESLAAVQTAIDAWAAFGGCDLPESQVHSLYKIANGAVSFRPGSTRVIVWFGDAPGHDPNFGVTLEDAIKALVGANIRVIAVPVVTEEFSGLDSTGQASAVAEATGGTVMPAATPEEVSEKILEGLKNLPVTVTPKPACDSGLTASYDSPEKTVASGSDVTFEETLSVSSSASGVLGCNVDFLLNGVSVSGFQQSVSITVKTPNQAPDCSKLTASPSVLWPPNHKLRLVTVSGATDPDGDPLTTTITSVTQDEPLNGRADGNTSRDAFPGPKSHQAKVRAERSGARDGRVYVLHVSVTDGAGGKCTGTATVAVPHDRRGKAAVDSGQSYVDF